MANKVLLYLSLILKAIKALSMFGIAYILTPKTKKEIWLISERGRDARDNGYWFFIFLKKQHPEIESYYVISKDSADYERISKFNNSLIALDSYSHFRILTQAKYLISTHIGGYLPMSNAMIRICNTFNLLRNKKTVFLQHGIIKDYIPRLFGDVVKLDLFCCGAKLEYDYVKNYYQHPENVVQYTGLCRYDNLHDCHTKRQILIMPTWRTFVDLNNFEESDFFKTYANLLINDDFKNIIFSNNYSVVFYLHYQFQSRQDSFKKLYLHPAITIAGFEYDVQTLLKESSLLITDYSSVYFDMAYMSKPVIFYQFDRDMFFQKHYQKGYIEEKKLGFVVYTLKDLLEKLNSTISKNCAIEEQYKAYANLLFEIKDCKNCERVYKAILNL